MMFALLQIAVLVTVMVFETNAEQDTVFACVPDNKINVTFQCRGVKYYLQQQPRISCDEVCQSRGLLCTAEDHGFTNENVLSIFASLLPSPCKTDFSNTDRWGEGGPSYLNHTDGHKRAGRCYGVKSIPKQILCGKVPSQPTTVRLCPCINDVSYHLSKGEHATCDDVCKLSGLKCSADNHGFTVDTTLQIFASLLGTPCELVLDGQHSQISPFLQDGSCFVWKHSARKISCGAAPNLASRRRLCPCISDCSGPLGMESGGIPDEAITASSEFNSNLKARRARLNMKATSHGYSGSWAARYSRLYKHPWLQVDLGSYQVVSKVATQGRDGTYVQWVTSYTLSYSQDGVTFIYYRDQQNRIRVFQGNKDQNTVVTNLLSPHIQARYVRVKPKTFHGHISMRIELYGCKGLKVLNSSTASLLSSVMPTSKTEIKPTANTLSTVKLSHYPTDTLALKTPSSYNLLTKSLTMLPTRDASYFSTPFGLYTGPSTTKASLILPSRVVIPLQEYSLRDLTLDKNNVSTTSVLIKWRKPQYPLISGYHVSHKAIEEADFPVYNATLHGVVLNGSSTMIQITGLESYTTYNITVTPIARSGVRMKSKYIYAETCRCPRELRADWWVHPPYTVLTNQSSASGIIPDFLMGMVQDLCGVCPSHGHTNIDFKIKSFMKKRSTSDTTKVEEADLIFPVGRFQGWETFKGYNYIPLVSVPGFALMKAGKKSHVAFVGKAAAKSLFDCWPYFFIYTSMMILAGIVIWILDSHCNPDHFPRSFTKGAGNGIWWSFISMTTVGYGDRYPRSSLGRVFAIIWFLIGMIINSLLVSAVTSTCSRQVLKEILQAAEPGKVVGVLKGSPGNYFVGVKKRYGASEMPLPNLTAMAQSLHSGKIDSVLLDINVAGYRKDLFDDSWCTVSKMVAYPFSFGAAVSRNAAKLERIFHSYLKENQAKITRVLQDVGGGKGTATSNEETAKPPAVEEKDNNSMLRITMKCVAISLGGALLCGAIFHFCWSKLRRKEINRTDHIATRYLEAKREMQLVVQEFRDNITRTYNQLKARHLKERKKLVSLMKLENERRGLSECLRGEGNMISPTPRARPVRFADKDTIDIINNEHVHSFAMKEFSGDNRNKNDVMSYISTC